MKVILSTTNKHKLKEISKILKGITVVGCDIKVVENGKTFAENALKKARAAYRKNKHMSLADDSGIMVAALNGKPGIKSARFVRGKPTPAKLCTKLLKLLKNKRSRKAKFVCVVAVVDKNTSKIIKGEARGKIAFKMMGKHGFGYDPVFIPNGFNKTFAQISPALKNKISHRARAFMKTHQYLLKSC